ncbi:hypothetical protein ACC702_03630 [Rhizobium ruizarguesonis]|jgi:hypothetical protein|uniref:hypothetical protein n=1 Tax=Rhizobium ruizarguesonis TaxID=2081791 RepID=UPI001030F7B9|nr:hypothetical protein [Rhizobium ruizarguesonis]TBD63435.1 hypothetical protein ELH22_08860 [Rhizobium ruizarguesonis]
MSKVQIAAALSYLLVAGQVRAQADDPFMHFPLLQPELGSEFAPDSRPTILNESLLEKTFEASDYHLIDPTLLAEAFAAHPREFALEFDAELRSIRAQAQLHDYAMSDAQAMLLLINLVKPNLLTRSASMLRYLNISIDAFNAYTEEKRKQEFCRYRVAIYRQNGIMYPEECW